MILINIHNFVFSRYKIKLHFVVFVIFFFSILGTKNADINFLQELQILMEIFTTTKNYKGTKKYIFIL